MKIERICLTTAIIAIVLSFAGCASYISTPEDELGPFDYPPEFFCERSRNRIDYQTSRKCAAYATAYLLRHFGEETTGEELYPELKRSLGFISANSITNVLEQHGYQAKACHGNIDTLKQQLAKGNPIIVLFASQKIHTMLSSLAMTSSTFIWWTPLKRMLIHKIHVTTGFSQRKHSKMYGKQEPCSLKTSISLLELQVNDLSNEMCEFYTAKQFTMT